jgi:PPP family 3-phenylpropionic acid transporter
LAFYAVLFAAFGVVSPFLPALLASKGLSPSAIGVVLGCSTAIRLVAGPAGGRLADRSGAARLVLTALLVAASVVALGYLAGQAFALLLLVGVLSASMLAPLNPIGDALAVGAADRHGFEYGWVRGAGSAGFILGTIVAGFTVGGFGLPVVVYLNAALLGAAGLFAAVLPQDAVGIPRQGLSGGMLSLLGYGWFVRLLLVAALVEGSHAMHDEFAMIRWRTHGISSGVAGLLWAEAVVAEVLVFAGPGPLLIEWLGCKGAAVVCALAGVLRWGVMTQTAWLPAMALIEPLHGLTFACLHLVCMRLIGRGVPAHLAATAQALYTTVAVGAMTAILTLASGPLYQKLGAVSFWAMALLCAAAVPLAAGLDSEHT